MLVYKKSKLMQYAIVLYVFFSMISHSSGDMLTGIARVFLILIFGIVNFRRLYIPKYSREYIWWALLFLLYAFASCIFAYSRSHAVSYSFTLAYVVICDIVVVISMAKDLSIQENVLKTIIFASIVKALLCYLQYGFFAFMDSRSTGSDSANLIGYYCAFACVLSLFFLKNDIKNRYLFLLAFIMNAVFMVLSASRKALIFLVIPLAIMWIAKSKNPIRIIRNTFLAIVMMMIVFILLLKVNYLYSIIGHRIETMINGLSGIGIVDASTRTRMSLIEDGWNWFKQRPIWGYGLSNFRALAATYRSWGTAFYAHNNYVELLVDCGIVGTVIYYFLHIRMLLMGARGFRIMNKKDIMLFGMLISILVCDYGMVSYYSVFTQLMLVIIFLSMKSLK